MLTFNRALLTVVAAPSLDCDLFCGAPLKHPDAQMHPQNMGFVTQKMSYPEAAPAKQAKEGFLFQPTLWQHKLPFPHGNTELLGVTRKIISPPPLLSR